MIENIGMHILCILWRIISMDKNYKHCKNCDTDCCTLWSSCNGCYYYEDKLICPNCERKLPNQKFRRKNGCYWCVPKKSTKYCNGKYI